MNTERTITLASTNYNCEMMTRDEFIKHMSTDLNKAQEEYKRLNAGEELLNHELFFDFQPNVTNGVPYECTLTPGDLYENQLGHCFDYVSQSKWWPKAHGWKLVYDCKGNHRMRFRGRVELLMDAQDTADRDAELNKMNEDIARFYANARYCGD